jgi:hypothetical protein
VRLLAAALAMLALAGCGSSANEHFTVESRLVGRSLEQAVYVPSGDTNVMKFYADALADC